MMLPPPISGRRHEGLLAAVLSMYEKLVSQYSSPPIFLSCSFTRRRISMA